MGGTSSGPMRSITRLRCAARCAAAALLCAALPAAADLRVGPGATNSIATARLDLGCTDLIVAGTLNLNGGTFVNVRDVVVQPGGVLFGGTGSITLSRNFTVIPDGQFVAQGSTVTYDTACGPGAPSEPVPTLGTTALAMLAAMLAALAMLGVGRGSARQRDSTKGAGK